MTDRQNAFPENLEALVRGRRSVRTFDGQGIPQETLDALTACMDKQDNPYDIPVTYRLLDTDRQTLKCPVIEGARFFVAIKSPRQPHFEEAVGYAFERFVLYAQSLGIGTTWIGGTMDRAGFEQAAGLAANEVMPCITPIGFPAKRMSLREKAMRTAVRADARLPFEQLFFDGDFSHPLTADGCALAFPLEMVRLAPSAVNRQPWRAVVTENAVHFYLKHAKGFVSEEAGDMQKIDMGIALSHFVFAIGQTGRPVSFLLKDPALSADADMEYIASYEFVDQ